MVTLPFELIELEKNNYHLLLKGRFSDGVINYWIIDTGASKSVFDNSQTEYIREIVDLDDVEIQSAGIQEGMVDTRVGYLDDLYFGDFLICDLKVALISLDHVNQIYERYCDRTVVGLIGSDILSQYKCVIDFSNCTILFNEVKS